MPGPALLVHEAPVPEETARLGAALARLARPGDRFCLHGPLGCGKTVLARGFIAQAAGAGTEVQSPTFTIVLTYPAQPAPVWHFDLYRIADADELWELGLEEAFDTGISLIEWPERLGDQMPADALWLAFEILDMPHDPAAVEPGLSAQPRRIALHGDAGWAARLRELRLD